MRKKVASAPPAAPGVGISVMSVKTTHWKSQKRTG
jgi:hypothetical protein